MPEGKNTFHSQLVHSQCLSQVTSLSRANSFSNSLLLNLNRYLISRQSFAVSVIPIFATNIEISETYPESRQTFTMKLFPKIVHNFQPLPVFVKSSTCLTGLWMHLWIYGHLPSNCCIQAEYRKMRRRKNFIIESLIIPFF